MPGVTYKRNLCPLQEQVPLTTETPHQLLIIFFKDRDPVVKFTKGATHAIHEE